MKNAIIFTQAKDNNKAVVANKYVAHAIYTQNKAIVEALGGEIIKGVDGFRAEFKSVKNAKAFIAQAICEMSAKEYAKTRKTEPKAKTEPKKVAPATAKGKVKTDELVAVTLADGTKLMVKKSDLIGAEAPAKKAPCKTKGNKPTTAPKSNAKAKVKAPRKTKGNCKVDFSTLAGKGSAANKQAAALMRKAGITDGTSAEYKAVWAEWCKVR